MKTDEQIAELLISSGRNEYYEILIERHKSHIVNFIYRMISDPDEARSLAQDVFIKVYEAVLKKKKIDNFKAFLFRTAKNHTLNYLNKHKRVSFFSRLMPGSESRLNVSEPEIQSDALIKEEQDRLVLEALKSLREEQRLALIMKVYMVLSYKEIADITGWSESKIETLISRAKSAMKKFIKVQERG